MNLPTNDFVLLSYINTKLRDEYDSLDALCSDLDVDIKEINERLNKIDYFYDASLNKFK